MNSTHIAGRSGRHRQGGFAALLSIIIVAILIFAINGYANTKHQRTDQLAFLEKPCGPLLEKEVSAPIIQASRGISIGFELTKAPMWFGGEYRLVSLRSTPDDRFDNYCLPEPGGGRCVS